MNKFALIIVTSLAMVWLILFAIVNPPAEAADTDPWRETTEGCGDHSYRNHQALMGTVKYILDGRTVVIETQTEEVWVELVGVSTPTVHAPHRRESRRILIEIMPEGSTVIFYRGTAGIVSSGILEVPDSEGQLHSVNMKMLAQGGGYFEQPREYGPEPYFMGHEKCLLTVERSAAGAGLGIWEENHEGRKPAVWSLPEYRIWLQVIMETET